MNKVLKTAALSALIMGGLATSIPAQAANWLMLQGN